MTLKTARGAVIFSLNKRRKVIGKWKLIALSVRQRER